MNASNYSLLLLFLMRPPGAPNVEREWRPLPLRVHTARPALGEAPALARTPASRAPLEWHADCLPNCMQVMPMRLPEGRPTSVDTSWAAARHGAQVSVSADVCFKATVGVMRLWLPP